MSTPYVPSDIEREAIRLVEEERVAWETVVTFVTDRVAFNMKNLIRLLRKNWWGIFDEPIDPQTGRKKINIPLTESMGETVVKNIDLDSKDVNFRAKKPSAVKLTSLVRSIVKNYLDKMDFGEKLDELETIIVRDGTCVWKTVETKDKDGYCTDIRIVDLLNVYIDPTSPSIQEANRFTERGYHFPSEFKTMKGWLNTEDLKSSTAIPRNDGFYVNRANTAGTAKARDTWSSYGKYPKYLLTGKKEDKDIEADVHIEISGLEVGEPVVHLIESYDGLKPYEEAWYTKVPGRWYGKGVAEKVMMLQTWINTVVNIRINRAYLAQQGIYKIRRGSGITPQMISRLPANGAVVVNSQDDLQQFVMQDSSPASYKDEDNVQQWAQRVTSAYEVSSGEQLPADTSATATALQSRSAQSQFVLVKKQIGMFLKRWLTRHAMPTIFKNITKGEIIAMAQEPDEILAWDQTLVDHALYDEVDRIDKMNVFINPMDIDAERQRLMEHMKRKGDQRFTKLVHDLDVTEYEVAIDITNESVDKGVIAQNLIQALTAAPEYRDQILPQMFDLMGLTFTKPAAPQQPMLPNGQPAGPGGQPTPMNPQTQNAPTAVARANTMATVGAPA